jgi:hypothetical protein
MKKKSDTRAYVFSRGGLLWLIKKLFLLNFISLMKNIFKSKYSQRYNIKFSRVNPPSHITNLKGGE